MTTANIIVWLICHLGSNDSVKHSKGIVWALLRFINQQRKPDNALKFDMCDIFLSFYFSFLLLNNSQSSLTCACTQAGKKKRKMYMHFLRFLFCNGYFQNARPVSTIALIAVLYGERPYIKTISRQFWFISRTHY